MLFLLLITKLSVNAFAIDTLGLNFSEQEKTAIRQSVEAARKISQNHVKDNMNKYRRDAHAKSTGCVKAIFQVNSNIPSKYQSSIFQEAGKSYPAWIRFSNGNMKIEEDKKGDARGMAIKVINTSGDRIAHELKEENSQDFIMANTKAFFSHNVIDYSTDIQYLASGEPTKIFFNTSPFYFKYKKLLRLWDILSTEIDNPLSPQYFSMLPYKLGESEIKFSTKPCSDVKSNIDKNNPNYLSLVLKESLAKQDYCFNFLVQERKPNMPLDDAVEIWDEKESPFKAIAKVIIPKQDITKINQEEFCEHITFNPWHGTKGWLPLGSLSKARRVVYNEVSKFRKQKNKAKEIDISDWCSKTNEINCSNYGIRKK